MNYLLVILLALSAFADNRGSSDLGLCSTKYSYSNFIAGFRDSPIIRTGWLDNTFNSRNCPNAERLMRDPRPLVLRVHILNGPGLRNKRLERHEIHRGYTIASLDAAIKRGQKSFLDKYRARLKRLKTLLAKRRGEMTVLISPCLECDLSRVSRGKLLQETSRIFPAYELVDNPLRDSCIKGVLCETHNRKRNADIIDIDGNSFSTSASLAWAREQRKARLFYFWLPCKNGNIDGQRFVSPTRRENFCGAKQQREINYLIRGEL